VKQDAFIGKQGCDHVANECGVECWGVKLLCYAKRILCSVFDVAKRARCSGCRAWHVNV